MQIHSTRKASGLAALLLALLPLLGSAARQPGDGEPSELTQRINGFSIDLVKHLAAKEAANGIISPQSIYRGLAMSYIASGGETRGELAEAVRFPDDDDALRAQLSALRQQVEADAEHPKVDARVANSLWLDTTYARFRPEYTRRVASSFGASLQAVRFGDRRKVCDRINAWVAEHTNGRIKGGIGPNDLRSRSRPGVIDEPALVTVNAMYFKADWASRFDAKATRERPFHPDPQTTEQAVLMHQRSLLRYAESEGLKFLELPYISRGFSMHVLLPKEMLALRDAVSLVSRDAVAELRDRAITHEVDVLLPKFEIGRHYSVRAALSKMGVTAAFDSQRADFDRMIVKTLAAFRIYLSEVSHDAWVAVHEQGTEAAAATTSTHYSIGCSARDRTPRADFHADHPFLFFIVHNRSRSILFAGWVASAKGLTSPAHAAAN